MAGFRGVLAAGTAAILALSFQDVQASLTVADDINVLYKKDDSGVLMHMYDDQEDADSPWLACLEKTTSCSWQPLGRLSFLFLNHYSWNEAAQRITTFGSTTTSTGFIGTESAATHTVDCRFPADGGSMQRSHNGCGCDANHPEVCRAADWYWCPEDRTPWDGVCAMHPDQLPWMLEQFHAGNNPYNEAVVDGLKWNDAVTSNILAFVIQVGSDSQCGKGTGCYDKFVDKYKKYTAQHGFKPIVGFNDTNKDAPFSPFVLPELADALVV